MIVSWNWLKDYVPLEMPREELERRLMMAGLNHESTETVGDDFAIDLEVTSNRPDCLGHIGVAREVAVLWELPLKLPPAAPHGVPVGRIANPSPAPTPVDQLTSVKIECPQLCTHYTARIIRGVKVGPSPAWLANRLRTIGITVINNIADITNYVMMECGQPLHAFDFARLAGRRIIVREARPDEKFTAIDHREYSLRPGMCVIADAQTAVALGGVMGGAETEVSAGTTDVLIEAADFDPVSIRTTARALNLHSPSSYRFERGVDPHGIDWASRRCAELILELAGGELAEGVAAAGEGLPVPPPIVLRLAQLERILGITVPRDEIQSILTRLGNRERAFEKDRIEVVPPSWRRDLVREADLIEEVARIHGYDKIPEDRAVPMAASSRSREDAVVEHVRQVLVAAGFDEALTISTVAPDLVEAFRPWSAAEPLAASTPVLRGADRLRQSLVPSLLAARRANEKLLNHPIELFETARIYLPQADRPLPVERHMLALTSGGGFLEVKGVVQTLVSRIAPAARLSALPCKLPLFASAPSCELQLDGRTFGFLGEVAAEGLAKFELRGGATVAEIDLGLLIDAAELVRRATPLSPFPPVRRDLNVVFDETVRWADVESIVRELGGELVEALDFQEEYRDRERLGPGKKSLLFSLTLRSHRDTLTNEAADQLRDKIVARLEHELHGKLRA
jgi:phenylalanyl-tRNA synthetase beta chain